MVHLCVAGYVRGELLSARWVKPTTGSEFEATAAAVLELDQSAHRSERREVLFAVERGEHAGVVVERGDGWAEAVAERLALGAAAEVVVAARAGGFRDDLQLTGVGGDFEHGAFRQV